MYDVLIIGAGPAGISAGIYAKRLNMKVSILYYGKSNLEKTTIIENYYGFEQGIDGKMLYENGINQAKNLGIEVKQEEVINIEKNDEIFTVTTTKGEYIGKTVIIASGDKKLRPNIKGIQEFEGKGISYCAICDGFFYKNKNVVVIGNGQFAENEAKYLQNIVNDVTILTNGLDMKIESNFKVNKRKIKQIEGENRLRAIEFEDGSKVQIDGVFIACGEAGGSDFAKKIGVLTKNDSIIVDENMNTNVDGLFACGNVTGGLLQICKATYEGAKAGLAAVNFIRKE